MFEQKIKISVVVTLTMTTPSPKFETLFDRPLIDAIFKATRKNREIVKQMVELPETKLLGFREILD